MSTISEICLYFQGFRDLTPGQQQAQYERWGFKGRCVSTLSQLLGVSVSRIWHWGNGLDFPKMPPLQRANLMILYLKHQLAERDKTIRQQHQQIIKLQNQLEFRRWA